MQNKFLIILHFLLASSAFGNQAANLALDKAIAANDLREVRRQLVNQADPHNKDENGFTPLHYAVCLAEVEVIRALLAAGAQPYVAAKNGITAVMLSVRKNDPALVLLLLEHVTYENILQTTIGAEKYAMMEGHFELAAIIRGYAVKRQLLMETSTWFKQGIDLLPVEIVEKIGVYLQLRPFKLPKNTLPKKSMA